MVEEIKMIIETLQSLSGTAFWSFVIYLIVSKLLAQLIGWVGVIILACLLTKGIIKTINVVHEPNLLIKQIRDNLEVGGYGMLSSDEVGEVREKIPELLAAYKEKKKNR